MGLKGNKSVFTTSRPTPVISTRLFYPETPFVSSLLSSYVVFSKAVKTTWSAHCYPRISGKKINKTSLHLLYSYIQRRRQTLNTKFVSTQRRMTTLTFILKKQLIRESTSAHDLFRRSLHDHTLPLRVIRLLVQSLQELCESLCFFHILLDKRVRDFHFVLLPLFLLPILNF